MVCDIWYDGVSRLTQIFNCGEKRGLLNCRSLSPTGQLDSGCITECGKSFLLV